MLSVQTLIQTCRSRLSFRLGVELSAWVALAFVGIGSGSIRAADDACVEDGGTARCIGPDTTNWVYGFADANLYSPAPEPLFSSEAEAVQAAKDWYASLDPCGYDATDQTASWPEGPVPEGVFNLVQGTEEGGRQLQHFQRRSGYLSTESRTEKMPYRVNRGVRSFNSCIPVQPYGASVTRHRGVFCPGNPSNVSRSDYWQQNWETLPTQAYCWKSAAFPDEKKNLGPDCNNIGNPVNAASGNKYESHTDYEGSGPAPLYFRRTYNSGAWRSESGTPTGYQSRLGYHWRSNYDAFISLTGGGRFTTAHVHRPDGRTLYFKLAGGVFVGDKDISDQLTRLINTQGNTSGWKYKVSATESLETYDAAGRLISIADRRGFAHSLSYDATGRLSMVADGFGRSLTFGYDSNSRLASFTDPASSIYSFGYDGTGNLTSVTYPDGFTRRYVYGEAGASARMLTGIIDESQSRFSTYTYTQTNTGEKVASSEPPHVRVVAAPIDL